MKNTKMSKIRAAVLMFVLTLVLTSLPAFAGVKLNEKKATLSVGQTLDLKVKGTKKKVKWSSTNKKVATVDKTGKVTARKAGKTVIKAKIKKKTYKCKLTVQNNTWKYPGNIGSMSSWSNLALCNASGLNFVKARTYSLAYDAKGNLIAKIAVVNMTLARNYYLKQMKVRFVLNKKVVAEGHFCWENYCITPESYDIVTVVFDNGGTKQKVDLKKYGGKMYFSIATN